MTITIKQTSNVVICDGRVERRQTVLAEPGEGRAECKPGKNQCAGKTNRFYAGRSRQSEVMRIGTG